MKESCGDLEDLRELGKVKSNPYTIEQIIDSKLKVKNGENMLEVSKRMNECITEIISKNLGKKIAIISHGAAIKFYIMKWCKLIENDITYNGKILCIDSPSILKLTLEDSKIIDLKNV